MSQNVSSISRSAVTGPQEDPGLSQTRLSQFARTYDQAEQPVWIFDQQARCVYRNHSAMCSNKREDCLHLFDIVDHGGQTVGYLSLA